MAKAIKSDRYNGHKNLELLRFYISSDIRQLESKLDSQASMRFGYIIASLVELLLAFLFGDVLDLYLDQIQNGMLRIISRICIFVVAIAAFFTIAFIGNHIRICVEKNRRTSGKALYVIKEEQQKVIDNFDNIACDGLLICQNYMEEYEKTNKPYLKDFYMYEIIHHMNKALIIGNDVMINQKLFISSTNPELLDSYRVNNFIIFSKHIIEFIEKECQIPSGNEDLDNSVKNLSALVREWSMI